MEAYLVVEHQRSRHKGSTQQNYTKITLRIGQYGRRRAKCYRQRRKEGQSHHGQQHPCSEGKKETRGCHAPCRICLASTQLARNEVARTMPEEKSNGLNDRHDGEDNAHGGSGLRIDFAHKVRVGHVVERRYQHTDDGRHSQRQYEATDWTGRQHREVVFGAVRVAVMQVEETMHDGRRCRYGGGVRLSVSLTAGNPAGLQCQ